MYHTYVVFACLIARGGGLFFLSHQKGVFLGGKETIQEVIISDITQYKLCPVAGDDPNKQARNETSRVVSQQVRLARKPRAYPFHGQEKEDLGAFAWGGVEALSSELWLSLWLPLSVEDLRISPVTRYFSSSAGHEVLRTCPVTCVFPLCADEDLRPCPVTWEFNDLRFWFAFWGFEALLCHFEVSFVIFSLATGCVRWWGGADLRFHGWLKNIQLIIGFFSGTLKNADSRLCRPSVKWKFG